jgi:integrase
MPFLAFQLRLRQTEAEERKRGLPAAAVTPKPFGQLCDYWIEKRAVRKRSGATIRRHLRPSFGHLLARDVGVEEGDDFILERDHLNPKTIATHVTLLISILRLGKSLGWIDAVPEIKKPKVSLFSTDFLHLRNQVELRRFLVAARPEGELVYALYATAALTGLRAGELAALRWENIDFEKRLITVQGSFGGPTKSNRGPSGTSGARRRRLLERRGFPPRGGCG